MGQGAVAGSRPKLTEIVRRIEAVLSGQRRGGSEPLVRSGSVLLAHEGEPLVQAAEIGDGILLTQPLEDRGNFFRVHEREPVAQLERVAEDLADENRRHDEQPLDWLAQLRARRCKNEVGQAGYRQHQQSRRGGQPDEALEKCEGQILCDGATQPHSERPRSGGHTATHDTEHRYRTLD